MNREEILQKSQRENNRDDQWETHVARKGTQISYLVLWVLWVVFLLAPVEDVIRDTATLMAVTAFLPSAAYQTYHHRTKVWGLTLLLAILLEAGAIVNFLPHLW